MKKSLVLFSAALALMACSGNNGGNKAGKNDTTEMEINVLVPEKVAENDSVDLEPEKEAAKNVALTVIKSDGYGNDFKMNVTEAFAKKVKAGEPIMTLHGFDIMDVGLDIESMKVKSCDLDDIKATKVKISDLQKCTVIVVGKAEEPNYDDETTERYDVSWKVTLVMNENGNWMVSAVKLL